MKYILTILYTKYNKKKSSLKKLFSKILSYLKLKNLSLDSKTYKHSKKSK